MQTNPQPAERVTLGDLLYADASRHRVREEDWQGLVTAVAAGDKQALLALFERSHRIVFTLLVRITGSRQAAEELTVHVFRDVWRGAAAYDSRAQTVVGWIMNLARAKAIDRVPPAPHANPRPAHPLEAALATLTPTERKAIEDTFFAERTCTEAAARLGVSPDTVKSRIHAGLAKLRRALNSAEAER